MDVLWARPGKNPSLLSSFDRRVPQKIMYRIRPTSPSASSTSFYSHSPRAVLRRGWAQPNYRQFIHRRDDCCSRIATLPTLLQLDLRLVHPTSVQLPTISQISTMAESRTCSLRSLRLTVELQDAQNANWTLDSDSLLRIQRWGACIRRHSDPNMMFLIRCDVSWIKLFECITTYYWLALRNLQ